MNFCVVRSWIFSLTASVFWMIVKKNFPIDSSYKENVFSLPPSPSLSLSTFKVSFLKFESLIHFQFIWMHSVWNGCNFPFFFPNGYYFVPMPLIKKPIFSLLIWDAPLIYTKFPTALGSPLFCVPILFLIIMQTSCF